MSTYNIVAHYLPIFCAFLQDALVPKQGKRESVFKHYSRWEENGVWADTFKQFTLDPDMEAIKPDSTTVGAQICAASGSKEGDASKNSAKYYNYAYVGRRPKMQKEVSFC